MIEVHGWLINTALVRSRSNTQQRVDMLLKLRHHEEALTAWTDQESIRLFIRLKYAKMVTAKFHLQQ